MQHPLFWDPTGRSEITWWRHQMETFSALLAICAENSPVPGEFPAQRPVTRSFDVFSELRLNKRLSKQSWGWWFETLSCSLWRYRNDRKLTHYIPSNCIIYWRQFLKDVCPAQLHASLNIWKCYDYKILRNHVVIWAILMTLQERLKSPITRLFPDNLFKQTTKEPSKLFITGALFTTTVEVKKWISNFIPYLIMDVITYPSRD